MNIVFMLNDLRALPLMYQLGFKNGKKEGEGNLAKEAIEVSKRHPDWITILGNTELTPTEFANEQASHGKRVLHIKKKEEEKDV